MEHTDQIQQNQLLAGEQHKYQGIFNEQVKKNQGIWDANQQKKYIIFLQVFKKQLQNKQKRKNYKIFKQMALFVGSRDGIQCRSHHMKLLRTHSKIRKIITHFKNVLKIESKDQDYRRELNALKSQTQSTVMKPLTKKLAIEKGENQSSCLQEPSDITNRFIILENSALIPEPQFFCSNIFITQNNPVYFYPVMFQNWYQNYQ